MSSSVSLSSPYGLTREGFVRQRLVDIQRSIADELNTRIGITFDTEPDSLTGQFIAIFAEREAVLWEQLEDVYLSMYPSTAEGDALDEAVAFSGVVRQPAIRGEVIGQLFGGEGVVVSAGASVALVSDSRKTFRLFTSVTISRNNASDVQYTVTSTTPQLEIDDVLYQSAAGMTTPANAAASLADAIEANPRFICNQVGINLLIQTANGSASYFSSEQGLALASLGAPGLFRSDDAAEFNIAAGDLQVIQTPTSGWQQVTNRMAGSPGQRRETDEELRLRYRNGVFRLGAGTTQSLRANLEAIPGTSLVRVYDNKTDAADAEGRPPHSFEAVVIGGNAQEIARVIHENTPAGIPSFGNVSQQLIDNNGLIRQIFYTVPVDRYIWLRLEVFGTNEEILPIDYAQRMTLAAEAYGATLLSGENVYLDRVKASVVNIRGVSGVGVEAGVGTATVPPATYTTADISISSRERAVISASRILVMAP